MSRLGGDNDFDLSDGEGPVIDKLDDVLDVATGVIEDYGLDGNTRIQRMARWLSYAVGGDPIALSTAGALASAWLSSGDRYVTRAGDQIALINCAGPLEADEARELAVALLRIVELVEP